MLNTVRYELSLCMRFSSWAIKLIKVQPKKYLLENPATGKMKMFLKGPFTDVSYHAYGYDYKKPTRIWHNLVTFEPRVNLEKPAARIGRSDKPAPSDGSKAALSSIPPDLVKHLFETMATEWQYNMPIQLTRIEPVFEGTGPGCFWKGEPREWTKEAPKSEEDEEEDIVQQLNEKEEQLAEKDEMIQVLEQEREEILEHVPVEKATAIRRQDLARQENDEYYTPKDAWAQVAHLIPEGKVIWEPFFGDGKSGEYLRELGFEVIHEDEDFFEHDKGDIVVTNPPFSKTHEILERLKVLGKPFMLIMPSSRLHSKYFHDLFGGDETMQVVVPPRRIQFECQTTGEKSKAYKDTIYYCWGFGLKRDLVFL